MTTSYVDFTYYEQTYLGNQISSADFPRLALRASAAIDILTHDRAALVVDTGTDLDTIDQIKMAVCSVAEVKYAIETMAAQTNNNIGIKSESVGSLSVSYIENPDSKLTDQERYLKAAMEYLHNTGLLFAGFYQDEYGLIGNED